MAVVAAKALGATGGQRGPGVFSVPAVPLPLCRRFVSSVFAASDGAAVPCIPR